MNDKPLAPLEEGQLKPEIVSDLWFDETTKVGMMADKRIENTLLKLQGQGKTKYDATQELRSRWIRALWLEQEKRIRESRATKVS